MAGLLILLLMVLALLFAFPAIKKVSDQNNKEKLGVTGKTCPPHQWQYFQVKNQFDEDVWVHVCGVCKKKSGEL